ncbi:hypothetical protein ACN93_18430 [Gordonia paraffinivorans]|nr:hypothetical protein ACN93_18430 [Gordonia paraffinivorans]
MVASQNFLIRFMLSARALARRQRPRGEQHLRDGRVALVPRANRRHRKGNRPGALESGARVAVTGRCAEKGRELLDEAAAGENLVFVESDALADGESERVAPHVRDALGPIEILVNNVGGGTGEYGRIDKLDPGAFRRGFELNVMTAVDMTHAVLPQMIDGRWGRILMVASGRGQAADPVGHRALRDRQARADRVVEVDRVRLRRARHHLQHPVPRLCGDPDEGAHPVVVGRQGQRRPLRQSSAELRGPRTGRHATLDEVAHAALSLLGERAGAITGTTLNVDGGSSPY